MNLTTLKKLAEAALVIDHNECYGWYSAEHIETHGVYFPKNARFIAAANPKTILQMIEVMEQFAKAASGVHISYHDQYPAYTQLNEALAAYRKLKEGE
jgi:hypothetical protein